ncbi:MAG TPA: hypothetical protein VFJ43_02650 [Bacteroidia bacterium]|nr:hypothetical protein [Bacteroidia bacterium]
MKTYLPVRRNFFSVVGLLFFLPLFFVSCEGDVRFTTDQPDGVLALKEVPSSLQGNYVDSTDSLFVTPNTMTLIRPTRTSIPIADTVKVGLYKAKDGKLKFHAGADRYVERESKDSITYITRNSQIYKLGKDTILKSFNDAYWLSTRDPVNKNEWKVMQITVHKSKLVIAIPVLPKDEKKHMQMRMDEGKCSVDSLGAFSCVTPFRLSSDQTYYIVTASQDELRNLDRRGLFRPVATFLKVK